MNSQNDSVDASQPPLNTGDMNTGDVKPLETKADDRSGLGPLAAINFGESLKQFTAVREREFFVLPALVVLADFLLYQVTTYTSAAWLLVIAQILVILGAPWKLRGWDLVVVATMMAMIWGIALRLIWCGNPLAVFVGLILLGGTSVILMRGKFLLRDLVVGMPAIVAFGGVGAFAYLHWLASGVLSKLKIPRLAMVLQFVLPPVLAAVFAVIFVMANPDVVDWIRTGFQAWIDAFERWMQAIFEEPRRFLFWGAMLWISIGLLRPALLQIAINTPPVSAPSLKSSESLFYPAFRNTLVLLCGLFVAYLAFEFWTMWTKPFPPGFYYAGYAHKGAAWLTIALGLATLVLSAMFRGSLLRDPRLPSLQRLAMIWSFLNLLLAIAVYNRLFIYIHFNGMTRMRVVGLFGVTTVVVGLLLVIIKIRQGYRFSWLIRMQAIALAAAIYLYAILPVDAFVIGYDVRQVLSGNLKPSVQIAHHPTSIEGELQLFPLLNCPEANIRSAIAEKLLLTARRLEEERVLLPRSFEGRMAYQTAEERFRATAQKFRKELAEESQSGAWDAFTNWSYQWY